MSEQRPRIGEPAVLLIIEDIPNVTRLIRASLAGKPVRFETAIDGLDGLERARRLNPALVLLDLALPSMHGFDVLRELRDDPATAATPVIVVTAACDSETALMARDLGADHFVAKPFTPNELRRAIDRYLDGDESSVA